MAGEKRGLDSSALQLHSEDWEWISLLVCFRPLVDPEPPVLVYRRHQRVLLVYVDAAAALGLGCPVPKHVAYAPPDVGRGDEEHFDLVPRDAHEACCLTADARYRQDGDRPQGLRDARAQARDVVLTKKVVRREHGRVPER